MSHIKIKAVEMALPAAEMGLVVRDKQVQPQTGVLRVEAQAVNFLIIPEIVEEQKYTISWNNAKEINLALAMSKSKPRAIK